MCVSVRILYAYVYSFAYTILYTYLHAYMHSCIRTHKVEDQTLHGDGSTAMQSNLGNLLSGPTTSTQTVDKTLQIFHTVVQPIEENDINKFWDVKSINTLSNTKLSSNSQFLTSYLKFSVECQSDGSYINRKVPWKENHPSLPSNRHVCEKRARSLAHKLSQTPDLLQLYGEIISD